MWNSRLPSPRTVHVTDPCSLPGQVALLLSWLQIGEDPDEAALALDATMTLAVIDMTPTAMNAAPSRRTRTDFAVRFTEPHPSKGPYPTHRGPRIMLQVNPLDTRPRRAGPIGKFDVPGLRSSPVARIDVPDGEGGEAVQMWTLRPEMGKAVARFSKAAYHESI